MRCGVRACVRASGASAWMLCLVQFCYLSGGLQVAGVQTRRETKTNSGVLGRIDFRRIE
jgi:hypothetical protein